MSAVAEIEAVAVEPSAAVVGIDRGITQTLTFSTGEHLQARDTVALNARIRRARRGLARRKRGSVRYAVARRGLSALTGKAARIRSDWTHRASRDIAGRFGLVAIEALNIKGMTASGAGTVAEPGRRIRQKAGLNRSILEQCWRQFADRLDYKLTERGGVLISVPAAYTSQTCASCGVVDARSRKSQAAFECVHCDHTDNADVNAAKEILRRSTALMGVEGSHWRPVETPLKAAA
jgi:putative transposase